MKKIISARKVLLACLGLAAFTGVALAIRHASAAGLRCTMSSETSFTGRQWAEVDISPQDPTICLRRRLGGDAPRGYPSCHRRAYDELGCTSVIDIH